MRQKHVPQRTCVACRAVSGKRQMVRIVRTVAGPVQVDETGKKAGRGAYLCRQKACWSKALKSKQLEHALKTVFTPEDLEALKQFASSLPEAIENDDIQSSVNEQASQTESSSDDLESK
jgi:hypothetical protein